MLHYRFARKPILIVGALITASAIFAVVLTPAASEEIRPLLQSLGIMSCSSPNPCQEGSNSSTGPGLEGISAKGKGVVGQTKFNSTSASNGQAGLVGQDLSTTGAFDSGVFGSSIRGSGVQGSTSTGEAVTGVASGTGTGVFGQGLFGVVGLSKNGYGVAGSVTSSSVGLGVLGTSGTFLGCANPPGAGVCGTAVTGNGVYGASRNDNGGEFHAGVGAVSEGRSGVFANDDSTSGSSNFGGFLSSSRGVGVEGFSNFVGVNAVGGADIGSSSFPALSVVGNGADNLIDACPASTANPCDFFDAVFRVRSNGEVSIAGKIFTSGSCSVGCLPTNVSGERRVRFFTPQESLPTVEDFGEAQLVNGQGYVRLSPDFANVVDQRANYLVMLTPEGPSRGLYVTQKTPAGFAVVENPGGHSTLAFSYRIVAKPFGSHEARLPMVELPRLRHLGLPTHTRPLHV